MTWDHLKMTETRNSKTLRSFVKFAEKHPTYRFWQALGVWAGLPHICWTARAPFLMFDKEHPLPLKKKEIGDTYYWKGRSENND